MAWIKSHTNISKHHKIKRMAEALKISIPQMVGHLHCLWHNVLELRENGNITEWTYREIAEYSLFKGDANLFCHVLIENKMIDFGDGKTKIHDWLEYAGGYLQSKYRSNKEKWGELQGSLTAQSDCSVKTDKIDKIDKIDTHELIKTYCELFKERYKKNPVITAKDSGIAKRIAHLPLEVPLSLLLQKFFDSKDKFILQNKHSLNILESQINKLLVDKEDWRDG